jgi:cytochrome P450
MRDLYGAKSVYEKAPIYGAFGRKSLFTMRNKEEHRARAKRIGHVFGPSSLTQLESVASEQIEKFLQCMNKRVGEPMDMLLWFRMLALDTFGEYSAYFHREMSS